MKYLYTLLFSLSIILINPWGNSRGEIWTFPKVFSLVLITLLNLSILWKERESITVSRRWKISKLLWELFLGIGFLSTLLSPFPLRSLLGQNEMGDGWLYWLVISVFTLSNTLVIKLRPELLRSQFNGLLFGGGFLALCIFPQVINWRIDYTITQGQVLKDNILASTIFIAHQPVGLYSHRGHAAIVLAFSAVLATVGWQRRWISDRNFIITLVLIIPALLLTQTRAAILAILVAIVYLLGRKYYKLLIPAILVGLLVVGITTTTRQIAGLSAIKQITSDRIYLWQLSVEGIVQRPLLGWGMNGFGVAYPYIHNPQWIPRIVRLDEFSFDYVDKEGRVGTKSIISNKAHNLILDTTLSVGIVGMLCYGVLFGYCLWGVVLSPLRGMEAVIYCYLVFGLTWFECAQFTHIVWWAIGLWNENWVESECLARSNDRLS